MKLFASLLALPVLAQQLYLMPSSFRVSRGERITVAAQIGPAFPDSQEAPSPAKLKDPALYTGQAAYNLLSPRVDGKSVLYDANIRADGSGILAIQTPDSSAKAIIESGQPSAAVSKHLGHVLEIVPLARPARTFPVQVLFQGKPATGVDVELASDKAGTRTLGRTDDAGKLTVKVEQPGRYRLAITRDRRTASLTFQIDP